MIVINQTSSDHKPVSHLNGKDILAAFDFSLAALSKFQKENWNHPAGDLDWTCLQTLNHLIDVTLTYSARLALKSKSAIPSIRSDNSEEQPEDLLVLFTATTHILVSLVERLDASDRVFHPAGMADSTGYAAMACAEILLHSFDISQGLGFAFKPDDSLSRAVLTRLFPWVDPTQEPWSDLCWASNRSHDHARSPIGPSWWWHCAPLEEWDGKVKSRG